MNFEEGLEILDKAVFVKVGRWLSQVEVAILKGSWIGKTYEQIANETSYSVSYLKRDVGPKLWKMLTDALSEEVSKTNFLAALERRRQSYQSIETSKREAPNRMQNRIDLSEAVDVSVFHGRSEELATLKQWVVGERCRLVAVLGMAGIGKTAVAASLVQQVCPEFDFVIWRSLSNAPPLKKLLAELISFVSGGEETTTEIRCLTHYLRYSRCLLILDNMETILDASNTGQFRPGYEEYGELLRAIGETSHSSCLILTSREKPAVVGTNEGEHLKVRALRLLGSPEAALALLRVKELVGNEAQKHQLCQHYSNNPLALKIVASSICDLFNGEIDQFLQHNTFIFNGIRRLLDQQFRRLSSLEQTIIYWLAMNSEGMTIVQLQQEFATVVTRASLFEALESLWGRSLLEKQANYYMLQPFVLEYVSQCLDKI